MGGLTGPVTLFTDSMDSLLLRDSSDSKSADAKRGTPQLGQCQVAFGSETKYSKTGVFTWTQSLWNHTSHSSQATAGTLQRTARPHTPQGYFGLYGISPDHQTTRRHQSPHNKLALEIKLSYTNWRHLKHRQNLIL